MTATILQEKLAEEIGSIFKDDLFKDSSGKYTKINIFEQNLPIRQDEDAPDSIPYIIVRLENGTTKNSNSGDEPQEVLITLLIGYFDDNTSNNGHKGVLGMIQKIYERFEKNPMLANQFMFQNPFDWALQDEESFPYFFGAISMTFKTAAIRKEDKFA